MSIETSKTSGGQPGNNNASKNKLFYERIRKALSQDPQKLANIVDKLIEKAEEGDSWAVKEIMDRIDGKAIQATEISGADGQALSGLQVVFIDGKSES